MYLLIQSFIGDDHAAAVAWGCEQLGAEVHHWYCSGFPAETLQSASVSSESSRLDVGVDATIGLPRHPDTIWFRRRGKIVIHGQTLPADQAFVSREAGQFISSIEAILCAGSRSVNDPFAERRAGNKLLQLKVARELGAHIPETLTSNDPKRIKAFLDDNGDCIVKTFSGSHWIDRQTRSLWLPFTALVGAKNCPDDHVLAACPAIYQRNIPKKHELRTFVAGDFFASAQIQSQDSKYGRIDNRAARSGFFADHVPVQKVATPVAIQSFIKKFATRLGIVSASFDFIVRPDGEFIFVECNPAGQFLWMDAHGLFEGSTVLDMFCRFLCGAAPLGKSAQPLTWSEFLESEHGQLWLADSKSAGSRRELVLDNYE